MICHYYKKVFGNDQPHNGWCELYEQHVSCMGEMAFCLDDELEASQPNWEYLESTVINCVRYHHEEEWLEIEFENGYLYSYYGVPEEIYEDLVNADSAGHYFNSSIKGYFKSKRDIS